MRNRLTIIFLICFIAGGGLFAGRVADAQEAAEEGEGREEEAAGEGDRAAMRLFRRAEELISGGERERGVKMMETIVQQYTGSFVRYRAYLALGKNFFDVHDQAKAIDHLRHLKKLKKRDKEITGDAREIFLEGLYLTGVCNFQLRQYNESFSVLRKITSGYPNTVWANQAHYYIGMAHFAQKHWNKAIKSLSLVGTFVDPDSPALEYVEAGRRFHIKVMDGDLPVLHRMGKKIVVQTQTQNGDKETMVCKPLTGKAEIFVGFLPTEIGAAKAGDGKLQVIGGDNITVNYFDDNTKQGQKNVLKQKLVQVVSSGSLTFTLGTYESKASAAFLGQPLFIKMRDVDFDRTPLKDTATIRVASMYKVEEEEEEEARPTMTVDLDKLLREEEEKEQFRVRDEVEVTLEEIGKQPVHTGIFTGKVRVERASDSLAPDKADEILSCNQGDQVVAMYMDDLHAAGRTPVEITVKLPVLGEIDSTPLAAQDVVDDPVVRAKKELVEAEAYLELARIFKGMRLMEGAKAKSDQGLDRVQYTLRAKTPLPTSLKELAFKLKWELHLAHEDLAGAMATCKVFSSLYPESSLVDSALMGIGRILMEREEDMEATKVFKQILALPNSQSKAEAQFLIAGTTERGKKPEGAIHQYRLCAKNYPDSPFAGRALSKVVDYHVKTKDYVVANDLLEQIVVDYQDEEFLDSMLLKWVMVLYRMGNFQKAHEKCSQLIFEYPGSPFTRRARAMLPRIEKRLNIKKEGEDEDEA